MNYSADIQKIPRHFLPASFTITNWESLEPWFCDLLDRPIPSREALEQWLRDYNELEAVISEDVCWRQIRMTCDTENEKLESAFNYFMLEIQPKIQPVADQLNRKLVGSPFIDKLNPEKYFTYIRNVKKNIELFREENIQLQADLNVMQQQFGSISGKMSITIEGKEYTLQQAAKFLENPDRQIRELVYKKIGDRRLEDKDALNQLFTQLVEKRNRIAVNTGFSNYRDYKFTEMGRFDYSPEDCFRFHEAVQLHVLPLVNTIYKRKKEKLGLNNLRPWDIEAHPADEKPLSPFNGGEELVEKTIACFTALNPFFGDCLKKMRTMGHLDLESRKGKAPGGYNCPLAESGAPFIFMNAAGQMDDVTTMVHEGGHAVHSFLAHDLELTAFKDYPMEMAEVASMSMELFSMDYWHVFFDNEDDLKRAREHQLERVITIFPWIATIDKFQHWVYEHPHHSIDERIDNWTAILDAFTSCEIDTSGLSHYRKYFWQKQLHLFEVPFYYIEYGIAQLAAIGLWKNFRENKKETIEKYMSALDLGGTKTLPELYRTAGIELNFSAAYIQDLMLFVHEELKKLG
ncbi:MAG: M3 family oligoendopeptidase [Terrimonas sp.]|nr:M3 family oligoendopeptidase [Terrimonas sp.]